MDLYTQEVIRDIDSRIICRIQAGQYKAAIKGIDLLVTTIHGSIPDKKRISHGIHYVIKTLGEVLYNHLIELDQPPLNISSQLYEKGEDLNSSIRAVSLQIMSFCALKNENILDEISKYFKNAASSADWELREHAAGFFRKVIKSLPNDTRRILIHFSGSECDKLRRFVSETLRPIADGQWIQKQPLYSLDIIRRLFKEPKPYPRSSVGNNLSDLSRRNSELIYKVVEELVGLNDRNAGWIAFRACRNLVKKDPMRVMDLLEIDEYKYKDRYFKR
jgi:3-methyladenine DNA glycosylase AlkC